MYNRRVTNAFNCRYIVKVTEWQPNEIHTFKISIELSNTLARASNWIQTNTNLFDFNFVGRFMFDCCMIKGEIFFPKLVSSFHLLHATSHLYCVVRYFTLVFCIFFSLFGSGYRFGSTECVTNISKYSIPCYTSFSLLSLNFSTNTDIWPNIIHAIHTCAFAHDEGNLAFISFSNFTFFRIFPKKRLNIRLFLMVLSCIHEKNRFLPKKHFLM